MNAGRTHLVLWLVTCGALTLAVALWTRGAAARLEEAQAHPAEVATASASDLGYCTGDLKVILKRVLMSCGLQSGGGARGCQPVQAKQVAAMSGTDFNALFAPLAGRAAILQFDRDDATLDPNAAALLEKTFVDRQGASYFFVVSRASPDGSAEHNRQLSQQRGMAVMEQLKAKFQDPDLEQEVGLLWLGEEFAQLDDQFCQWQRSRADEPCTKAELNRSAFIAWIDCRL
jgi:outer membrane protein OmpA-like peptidoglycan-associated protein